MQLLIILALLLYGTKPNTKDILSEARPLLEDFGGGEVKEAFKNAERISEVLAAVKELTGGDIGKLFRTEQSPLKLQQPAFSEQPPKFSEERIEENRGEIEASAFTKNPVNFPLAPVSQIADRDITYSLSRYISQN